MNVDSEKTAPHHRLFLLNTRTNRRVLLLSYPRWVGTLWSPTGDALAVNDHAGSDYSDCYVFVLGKSIRRIDILNVLRDEFPGDSTLFLNDHVYLDAVRWLSPDKVVIRAYGHGSQDPKGFKVYFEYRVGGRIRKLGHKSAG